MTTTELQLWGRRRRKPQAAGTAHQAMLAVGVVEITAGLLVALRPRIGGYVVAGGHQKREEGWHV